MKKKSIIMVATIIVVCFFSYQIVNFYKRNIGPDYCVKEDNNLSLSRKEAIQIAKQSSCIKEGYLLPFGYECNNSTGTWWLNMVVHGHPGCSPACVVNVETKQTEINWRCTGLLQSK